MTTFKTFLKVLNKCKVPVIMYTVILLVFGGMNMQTSDSNINFTATKPDILIINNDENIGITKNLVEYLTKNSNIVSIANNEESINDALFYRDVSYIIYIPKNYRNDFLALKNPEIEIKQVGDYESTLASMLLSHYLKTANVYLEIYDNEDTIISKTNETLGINTDVNISSSLDTDSLYNTTFYYNFLNYSLMAGSIYVICLVLSSFHEEKVKKRTLVSSMDFKKHNQILLISNYLFALVMWLFYILLSFIMCGSVLFTSQGLIYIFNSFIFTFCCVTIAFLISTLVNNKNAINGIINVVALGSSFLCGAFVPVELLPDSVLKIAHILPSYWYINTNELIKGLENINLTTLQPIIINSLIIIGFSIIFIIVSNVISYKKQKIN